MVHLIGIKVCKTIRTLKVMKTVESKRYQFYDSKSWCSVVKNKSIIALNRKSDNKIKG